MKHKRFSLFAIALVFVLGFLAMASGASAQGAFSYEALEAIPGSKPTGEISPYLQAIYRFALWAVGIAALFMLSVGGMMYLTSAGNTSALSTAKKVIFDALIGLGLAIVAWLILYVINPQLVEANLDIFTGNHQTNDSFYRGSAGNDGSHIATNPDHTSESAVLAQKLLNLAVAAGDCASADGVVSPKRNLEEIVAGESMTTCHSGCNKSSSLCNRTSNMSTTMLQGLVDMSETTGFTITSIAGGSHSLSSTHYSGNGVDIDKPNKGVDDYVKNNGVKVCNKVYKVTSSSNATLYFYNEDNKHWHIQTGIGNLCGG